MPTSATPRPVRRRVWIAGIVGAALASSALRARAAGPEQAPTSVDQALDQLETLISPEALAAFYKAPEGDVRELQMGLLHIYLLPVARVERCSRR